MFWLILGLLLLGSCSIVLRSWNLRAARLEEVTVSPLSQAVGDLVKVAGGIYVTLLALLSFLKIPIPSSLSWSDFTLQVDPLALISLILAILQPFLLPFFRRS